MTLRISGISNPVGIMMHTLPPTYQLTSNVNSVAEGNPVEFTLTTTNVSNGTQVPFTITGVTSADIIGGQLTGYFTINNNVAVTTITIASDSITNEVESMTMTVNGTLATKTVTITDTTPTYSLTSNINSVSEGSSVIFTLTTTNIGNGTQIPYTLTGVSSADITGGLLTGSFVIGSNTATKTIAIASDSVVSEVESLTMTINGIGVSKTVTIVDTTPTYQDPYFTNVRLLINGDGSISTPNIYNADKSLYNVSGITHVGSTTGPQVGASLYGGTRLYGGTTGTTSVGNRMVIPAAQVPEIGYGDFTVEFWFYCTEPTTTDISMNAFGTGSGLRAHFTSGAVPTGASGTTKHRLLIYAGPTVSNIMAGITNTSVSKDTWNFVAISRISGTLYSYYNGNLIGQVYDGTYYPSMAYTLFNGGELISNSRNMPGYLDEFRLTVGVGRYSGSTCPIPSGGFPYT